MKRRTFGMLSGGSLMALKAGQARAQSATVDASELGGSKLTPFGAERAGNADGSIPAWTGGMTSMPAGVKAYGDYVPDLFPGEQPVVVVNASNLDQHADRVPKSIQVMIKKYGLSLNVYPTHRTAAAPQWVYNNIKSNAVNAKFVAQDPVGGRFGFTGAHGGIPFPIPDQSNPLTAGAQIIWNHNSIWRGFCFLVDVQGWVVNSSQVAMTAAGQQHYKLPYYSQKPMAHKYDGALQLLYTPYTGPGNLVGQAIIIWAFDDPHKNPQEAWELLNGEGRVRRAPEVAFDTPSPQVDGIANYDEFYGFNGSLERYDWRLIEKKEVYIPYNNNKLYSVNARQAHKAHFFDPDLVRWELHRCWVVEATLHSGERNVIAKRVFYVDEDTWQIAVGDEYDGNMNLYKADIVYNACVPTLPGVIYGQNTINNLQTDNYCSLQGPWDCVKYPERFYNFVKDIPDIIFDPNHMAASSQY